MDAGRNLLGGQMGKDGLGWEFSTFRKSGAENVKNMPKEQRESLLEALLKEKELEEQNFQEITGSD